MAISDILIPALHTRFPDRGMRTVNLPAQHIIFPGVHPDVGDIRIFDEGEEVTVEFVRFTHGHFSNYDDNLTPVQKEQAIVDSVVQFLDDVFAERVVLWESDDGCGGWYYRGHEAASARTDQPT